MRRLTTGGGREDFHAGSEPAVASALIESKAQGVVVILVIDDHADDEMTAAIAEGTHVPSERFGGAWGAFVDAIGDVARFHLIERGGGMERSWTLPQPPTELLKAAARTHHLVGLLPAELAGDVRGSLEPQRLAAALYVEVQEPSAALEELLARRTSA